ncbi:hypothetical protein BH708_02940 [Brachybacterium sp. P6-10-X1]|nr:hypothetical protein BH708_02940 [Brachybacterium sp. P6-10-X1]
MTALSLEQEAPVLATGVVTMPRLSGARSTARRLATGGPIDAALIDCSSMQGSSLSMAQELIVQLVDVRGARWIQLIGPTPFWADRVRTLMQRRGMAGSLSVVPRASSAS